MISRTPSPTFAAVAIFVSAAVWGLYWVPLRDMEGLGVGGTWAVGLLNLPAAAILLPFVLRRWSNEALMIGAMTGMGLALYASGLVLSSVVRATLLFYLTPVWATLIGLIWLKEEVDWRRWTAIGIGLLGMGFLLSGGAEGAVPLNVGDLMALLSGLFWAIGAVLIRRFDKAPLISMAFWQFAFASLSAAAFALVLNLSATPDMAAVAAAVPVAAVAAILFILPTLLIIFWMQKFVSPGRVGLLMMSEVIVAVISASLFLPAERMSPIEWIGAVLIVAACVIEVTTTPASETAKG